MHSWAKIRALSDTRISPCAEVGHVPEHWKTRKTSGPHLLMGEGVAATDKICILRTVIMGFH